MPIMWLNRSMYSYLNIVLDIHLKIVRAFDPTQFIIIVDIRMSKWLVYLFHGVMLFIFLLFLKKNVISRDFRKL